MLVATVTSGNMKPYMYRGRYFVRSGAATMEMPPETQLRLVLERAHAFDRWETGESRRELDAIDADEVRAFRDEVTTESRGRFDSGASVAAILRAMNLLDESGRPNRAAVALFGRPGSFGSEWPCAKTWVGWGEILGMGVRPRWNR